MNQVQKVDEFGLPPLVPESTRLIEVISRAASDPNTDIAKLEKLLEMHERITSRQAEQDFNVAMTAAQMEMRPVAFDAENPSTKSKYASYAALDRSLRPIYTKHGFALSFGEGDTPKPDHLRVTCLVTHGNGYSRLYFRDLPADGKGAKGGDVMTKTHASGAAQSYGMRYLLKGIFNVAVGEDDDDGNSAGELDLPITADQLDWLRDNLEKTGSNIEVFCEYFKIKALPDLKQRDHPRAVEMLNHKARVKK